MSDIIFLPNQDYTLQDGGNPYIISAVGDSEGDAQTEATEKFNAEFSECQSYVYIGTLGNPINYGVDNGDGTWTWYIRPQVKKFVYRNEGCDPDRVDKELKWDISELTFDKFPSEGCPLKFTQDSTNYEDNYTLMRDCVSPRVNLAWSISLDMFCFRTVDSEGNCSFSKVSGADDCWSTASVYSGTLNDPATTHDWVLYPVYQRGGFKYCAQNSNNDGYAGTADCLEEDTDIGALWDLNSPHSYYEASNWIDQQQQFSLYHTHDNDWWVCIDFSNIFKAEGHNNTSFYNTMGGWGEIIPDGAATCILDQDWSADGGNQIWAKLGNFPMPEGGCKYPKGTFNINKTLNFWKCKKYVDNGGENYCCENTWNEGEECGTTNYPSGSDHGPWLVGSITISAIDISDIGFSNNVACQNLNNNEPYGITLERANIEKEEIVDPPAATSHTAYSSSGNGFNYYHYYTAQASMTANFQTTPCRNGTKVWVCGLGSDTTQAYYNLTSNFTNAYQGANYIRLGSSSVTSFPANCSTHSNPSPSSPAPLVKSSLTAEPIQEVEVAESTLIGATQIGHDNLISFSEIRGGMSRGARVNASTRWPRTVSPPPNTITGVGKLCCPGTHKGVRVYHVCRHGVCTQFPLIPRRVLGTPPSGTTSSSHSLVFPPPPMPSHSFCVQVCELLCQSHANQSLKSSSSGCIPSATSAGPLLIQADVCAPLNAYINATNLGGILSIGAMNLPIGSQMGTNLLSNNTQGQWNFFWNQPIPGLWTIPIVVEETCGTEKWMNLLINVNTSSSYSGSPICLWTPMPISSSGPSQSPTPTASSSSASPAPPVTHSNSSLLSPSLSSSSPNSFVSSKCVLGVIIPPAGKAVTPSHITHRAAILTSSAICSSYCDPSAAREGWIIDYDPDFERWVGPQQYCAQLCCTAESSWMLNVNYHHNDVVYLPLASRSSCAPASLWNPSTTYIHGQVVKTCTAFVPAPQPCYRMDQLIIVAGQPSKKNYDIIHNNFHSQVARWSIDCSSRGSCSAYSSAASEYFAWHNMKYMRHGLLSYAINSSGQAELVGDGLKPWDSGPVDKLWADDKFVYTICRADVGHTHPHAFGKYASSDHCWPVWYHGAGPFLSAKCSTVYTPSAEPLPLHHPRSGYVPGHPLPGWGYYNAPGLSTPSWTDIFGYDRRPNAGSVNVWRVTNEGKLIWLSDYVLADGIPHAIGRGARGGQAGAFIDVLGFEGGLEPEETPHQKKLLQGGKEDYGQGSGGRVVFAVNKPAFDQVELTEQGPVFGARGPTFNFRSNKGGGVFCFHVCPDGNIFAVDLQNIDNHTPYQQNPGAHHWTTMYDENIIEGVKACAPWTKNLIGTFWQKDVMSQYGWPGGINYYGLFMLKYNGYPHTSISMGPSSRSGSPQTSSTSPGRVMGVVGVWPKGSGYTTNFMADALDDNFGNQGQTYFVPTSYMPGGYQQWYGNWVEAFQTADISAAGVKASLRARNITPFGAWANNGNFYGVIEGWHLFWDSQNNNWQAGAGGNTINQWSFNPQAGVMTDHGAVWHKPPGTTGNYDAKIYQLTGNAKKDWLFIKHKEPAFVYSSRPGFAQNVYGPNAYAIVGINPRRSSIHHKVTILSNPSTSLQRNEIAEIHMPLTDWSGITLGGARRPYSGLYGSQTHPHLTRETDGGGLWVGADIMSPVMSAWSGKFFHRTYNTTTGQPIYDYQANRFDTWAYCCQEHVNRSMNCEFDHCWPFVSHSSSFYGRRSFNFNECPDYTASSGSYMQGSPAPNGIGGGWCQITLCDNPGGGRIGTIVVPDPMNICNQAGKEVTWIGNYGGIQGPFCGPCTPLYCLEQWLGPACFGTGCPGADHLGYPTTPCTSNHPRYVALTGRCPNCEYVCDSSITFTQSSRSPSTSPSTSVSPSTSPTPPPPTQSSSSTTTPVVSSSSSVSTSHSTSCAPACAASVSCLCLNDPAELLRVAPANCFAYMPTQGPDDPKFDYVGTEPVTINGCAYNLPKWFSDSPIIGGRYLHYNIPHNRWVLAVDALNTASYAGPNIGCAYADNLRGTCIPCQNGSSSSSSWSMKALPDNGIGCPWDYEWKIVGTSSNVTVTHTVADLWKFGGCSGCNDTTSSSSWSMPSLGSSIQQSPLVLSSLEGGQHE